MVKGETVDMNASTLERELAVGVGVCVAGKRNIIGGVCAVGSCCCPVFLCQRNSGRRDVGKRTNVGKREIKTPRMEDTRMRGQLCYTKTGRQRRKT